MSNSNDPQFPQPVNTRWILGPIYGVYFATHVDGSVSIEFQRGREDVVFAEIYQTIMHQRGGELAQAQAIVAARTAMNAATGSEKVPLRDAAGQVVGHATVSPPAPVPSALPETRLDENGRLMTAVRNSAGVIVGYEHKA
jgi:hypothetical protein